MASELQFCWDDRKNKQNQRKHGVSFEAATLVFSDPFHITAQDREVDGEPRWQTIGMVGNLQLLLVAHAEHETQNEVILRIISARKATRSERRIYAGQIENR